jgi:hypothetical protein
MTRANFATAQERRVEWWFETISSRVAFTEDMKANAVTVIDRLPGDWALSLAK